MYSLAHLQDLIPTLAGIKIYKQCTPARIGINLVDVLENALLVNVLGYYVYELIVANAAGLVHES